MRLQTAELDVIRAAVAAADPRAELWLFGSRADDAARGGDIDLLVFSSAIGPLEKARIRAAICRELGEQRILSTATPSPTNRSSCIPARGPASA